MIARRVTKMVAAFVVGIGGAVVLANVAGPILRFRQQWLDVLRALLRL